MAKKTAQLDAEIEALSAIPRRRLNVGRRFADADLIYDKPARRMARKELMARGRGRVARAAPESASPRLRTTPGTSERTARAPASALDEAVPAPILAVGSDRIYTERTHAQLRREVGPARRPRRDEHQRARIHRSVASAALFFGVMVPTTIYGFHLLAKKRER